MLDLLERVPVRWRIAITCAGLTLIILVCFALVLGNLVGDRIRDDHEEELQTAASSLAAETRVAQDATLGTVIQSPRLDDFAMAEQRRDLRRGRAHEPRTVPPEPMRG